MSSSSEDVNLTRSKDVTRFHLELNGYAAFGHHAQFTQHHGASHVRTVLTLIFWLQVALHMQMDRVDILIFVSQILFFYNYLICNET